MAVYTDVSDLALRDFLADYGLGKLLAYKGIAEGVENSNYLLHVEAGFFILTLYEKRVNADDLPFFLGLMEHLSARGLVCPQPVKTREGSLFKPLAGRPAAIVTFLEGVSTRAPLVAHCAALGTALAELHRAGTDFPLERANSLSISGWPPLLMQARDRADSVEPGLAAFLAAELAALEELWPRNLPRGVIHADLFPDNVLFLGDKVSGLIDFYFACTDFLAYDLAVCLNAWCFEPDFSYNVTKGKALIDAYQRARPLTPLEIIALPILARGAALRFTLTRLVDWLNVPPGALVKPKDPREYVRRLRFHQQATSPGDLGLAF
ncbi:homoserine kinase [Methylovirgula ligni]|uniref:Homoserine kinase n=1 Tax=Methylovirgula ligni TaxID=569860 RepID=A0A3D9Z3V8_9HYPH|nr:homoserine kinase [Methylovirgula ligni]QAY96917.1 homoserine kinase [Methylovirgula ligni]REF88029.1 homoserine kinase [Methylovirgula ligni]